MSLKGLGIGVLGLAFAGCSQVRSAATGECVGQRPVTVVMIDGLGHPGRRRLRRRNRRVELTFS